MIVTLKNFKNAIPEYIVAIAKGLSENGFSSYLVGGGVRDLLIGKLPQDFDIATDATPEQIMKLFEKSVPTGEKFGTITVLATDKLGERYPVEVTTFRSEEDYIGGRWPTKVEFTKNIEDDLARRDFTINAIAFDLSKFAEQSDEDKLITDFLIDPFGGTEDLKSKIIKAVRDPFERFTEDGLRPVRGCRLAAQLGFQIESATFESMKQTNHITKMVSIERFRDELLKLIYKSPKPSVGIRLLKDVGILQIFIPELVDCVGVIQPEFHTEDVFDHTMSCLDIADDEVKVAALFHDIAKPPTRTEDEYGIHFYGHDHLGAQMAKQILQRLKFPNAEIEQICLLIRWHMFHYPSADWRKENSDLTADDTHGWSDGAIRRLINNVGGEEQLDRLMKLRLADATSNKKAEYNKEELYSLAKRVAQVRSSDMALKLKDLDINGADIMENFQIPPSKKLGEVLNYLMEKVLDDPSLNKKLDLLRLTKKYLDQKVQE